MLYWGDHTHKTLDFSEMLEILDFDKSYTHRIIRVILAMAIKKLLWHKKNMGPTAYIAPNQQFSVINKITVWSKTFLPFSNYLTFEKGDSFILK